LVRRASGAAVQPRMPPAAWEAQRRRGGMQRARAKVEASADANLRPRLFGPSGPPTGRADLQPRIDAPRRVWRGCLADAERAGTPSDLTLRAGRLLGAASVWGCSAATELGRLNAGGTRREKRKTCGATRRAISRPAARWQTFLDHIPAGASIACDAAPPGPPSSSHHGHYRRQA
jgi:hypothetical protein